MSKALKYRLILKDSENRAVSVDIKLDDAPQVLTKQYSNLLKAEEEHRSAAEAKVKEVEERQKKEQKEKQDKIKKD